MGRKSASLKLSVGDDGKLQLGKKGTRFGFTIGKDITLLKLALQHNPFQLGSKKWEDVSHGMQEAFGANVTERTVKDRVMHLKKLYERQQLCFRTGTEEERSERGTLLEEILMLYEESVASINVELGASVEIDLTASQNAPSTTTKELRQERTVADEERAKITDDLVSDPLPKKKKIRLTPADELIKTKMEHDMKMETERFKLEEEKTRKEQDMEAKRLDLEMKRFEFEQEKEKRINEDNKRRDELAQAQIGIQEALIQAMLKFAEK